MASEYQVEIETSAAKEISRLQRGEQQRIRVAIDALAIDPRPHNAIKMSGTESYRVRVGNFRIVYLIDDAVRIVTVTRVGHRQGVYKK